MLRKCGFFTENKITAVLHRWLLSRSLHGDLAWWCTQGCDVTVKQKCRVLPHLKPLAIGEALLCPQSKL